MSRRRRFAMIATAVCSGFALLALPAFVHASGPRMRSGHARLAASTASEVLRYSIVDLNARESRHIVPTAIDDRGDVAGRLWSPGTHAFLYFAGHIHDLGIPPGFLYSGAVSVNDSRTVTAVAWKHSYSPAAFVVRWRSTHWRWSRLQAPSGRIVTSVGQVAANGDIVGVVKRPRRGAPPWQERAVIWRPGSHGDYGLPLLLPLDPGISTSEATLIYSGAGRIVVAGGEGSSHDLTLWSRRTTGRFHPNSDYVGLDVTTLGGWRSHVFAGGYGPGGGYDYTPQWAGHVTFDKIGTASVRPTINLYSPPGVSGLGAGFRTITSSLTGRVTAVGDGQGPGAAVVWRGVGMGTILQHLLPKTTPWTLNEADAINPRGQIAGLGTAHGQNHAFLLTPLGK